MSKHRDAATIVRNYIEALQDLVEDQGSNHLMHDAAVYGGTTLGEEINLAQQKLADLETKR
jgi:hypothetical protein